MSIPTFRLATHSGDGMRWVLKRNCSIAPAQLGWMYASLCVVSLGIASAFWLQGATLVLPFAWLELVAVGVAFLMYARHAADQERVLVTDGELVVEQEVAGRLSRTSFRLESVRVEPGADARSLIEVHGHGRSVSIGRHLRPELRAVLVREIRAALRHA